MKAAENLKGSIETIPALPGRIDGSYPSEVRGGLKVDEIVLGGVQRAVPVAVVRVVVAHGEGRGLGEAARGQLGRVVVGGRLARQRAVGVGGWETVGGAQLSPPHLAGAVLLHHHHLVGTERKPARGYCHQVTNLETLKPTFHLWILILIGGKDMSRPISLLSTVKL